MSKRFSALWFVAFILVVALAGGAGGVLVDRYVLRDRGDFGPPMMRPGDGPRMGGPMGRMPGGPRPGWLGQRLEAQLDLRPDQREQLHAILERRGQRIEQLRGELRQKLEAEQKGLREEINGILDEKQRDRFERMSLPEGRRPR